MPVIFRLPPRQGLFPRLLSALILLFVLVTGFVIGTVLFLAILGTIVVLALGLYLRFWWLRRKLAGRPRPFTGGGVTLEGEYTVSRPARRKGDETP